MYKIFADYVRIYDESVKDYVIKENVLIYDSTLEDYKIGKGSVTLETNKSGSFTFSIYPDHFCYDGFIKLKTVITVYKSGKIIFRGRILNDVSDYWNNKVITCEGELGFLQDSIIRSYSFTGTPEDLFKKFIEEHNSQVDDFKKFNVGTVTVVDPNDYIARSNSAYESSLSNLNSRLIEDSLGGYFYITHGDNGTDPIPTINYLADFTKVSSQKIEFGSNLKNYTKTVKANDIATAIIPLGNEINGNDTENTRLTIASVNDDKDYIYSEEGVALYGWIFKTVVFDDVTDANILKSKAEKYLETVLNQHITVEITAIDLHLLDKNIESFNVCDYIRVTSIPHNFDETLLCSKQTIDLLKPENDSYTLGYVQLAFTTSTNKVQRSITEIKTNSVTTEKLTNVVNETEGRINEKLTEKVGKDDNDQIVDMLNQSETVIQILANRLEIESDNFSLTPDGKMTARSANLENESGNYGVYISDGTIFMNGPKITGDGPEGSYDIPILKFREIGGTYRTLCVRMTRVDPDPEMLGDDYMKPTEIVFR